MNTNAVDHNVGLMKPAGYAEALQQGSCAEPWADVRRDTLSRRRELAIAIVDERPLMSECFALSLRAIDTSLVVYHFKKIEEYDTACLQSSLDLSVVLICSSGSVAELKRLIDQTREANINGNTADIIIFADINNIADLLDVIKSGVRGYIPMSASLDVAVKAIHLVAAGGVYIPASAIFAMDCQITRATHADEDERDNMFTSRQLSVLDALRSGKANKTIAYELNMCESTVKVHVRNIMKRLKAKNRTEVAYILNKMEKEGKGFRKSKSSPF